MKKVKSVTITAQRLECYRKAARYILEFEFEDWENEVFNDEPISRHPYTLAVLALYGKKDLRGRIADVKKIPESKVDLAFWIDE